MLTGEGGSPTPTSPRRARRWVPVLFSAAALLLLSGYLWRHRGFIAESYSLDPAAFGLVAGLALIGLLLRAQMNRLHFAGLGVAVGLLDWFRLVSMTAFTNYLPLSAGLFLKALFLKRVHDVPVGRFAVGQTTLLLLVLATNGMVGLGILALRLPDALLSIVGGGFAAMTLSGALLFAPTRLLERVSPRWFPLAENVDGAALSGWVGVVSMQLLMLFAAAVSLFLCFRMGAGDVGLLACLLFTAASVITRFVTIVPGALGVREFLIGGLAALTGFELRDAVVAATLARAAEIVVVFALGGAFTWSFSGELAARDDP